jgi:uncharacterized protein
MTVSSETAGKQSITVPITGMTCAACERRVGTSLLALPGVTDVQVSSARGTATLTADVLPGRERIDAAIRSAGYTPGAARWFSPEADVWKTFLVSVLAIAWIAWVLTQSGIVDFTSTLADPSTGGLAVVLLLGLTAGVSTCMAMVGGLVLGFSAAHAAKLAAAGTALPGFARRMRPGLVFNVGRIVGFGLLGALLGTVGATMSVPTRIMAVLVLVVGLVMLLLGIRLTGLSPRMAAWSPRLPAGLGRALGIDSANGAGYSDRRTAVIGAATFFLPCGFTQAVQIYALSTGSPLTAGLIMALFAVGTTPGLLALAAVPEIATGRSRVTVLRVVGVVVLAFALLNFSSGMRLMGFTTAAASAPAATATGASGQAQAVSPNVTLANGVQTVTMTQTPRGYEPADTVVYAGIPIAWSITATSPYDCSAFLRVPSLGTQVNLNAGVNAVDLPALDPGTTPFTCVMGMYSGNLIAVDAEPPAESHAASGAPAVPANAAGPAS